MSMRLLPRPPRCEGRAPGPGRLLRVALAGLAITGGAGRSRRCPGPARVGLHRWPGQRRPGARGPGQPGVEERSISTMKAVRPSSSAALSTRPARYRASPHARARRASRRASQRQPS